MIIAGNWKMNLTRPEAVRLVKAATMAGARMEQGGIVLFPPAILIDTAISALAGDNAVAIGGQDCHARTMGAHTGDIAAPMLAEAGCTWVLLGHSERRAEHHETSAVIAAKAEAALSAGLKVMICVGESLEQRESGAAEAVIAAQLRDSLPAGIAAAPLAIAYEPIWAIGTGKVAERADIAAMHDHIAAVLVGINADYASVPILYGGSVNAANAREILALDGVGGVLVGSASLQPDAFGSIIEAAL